MKKSCLVLKLFILTASLSPCGLAQNEMSMSTAISVGNLQRVQAIIAAGVDANDVSKRKMTALTDAIRMNRTEIIKYILESGIDVNAKNQHGYTALSAASSKGNVELVNYLLAAGADVHATSGNEMERWTPLCDAVSSGQHEVVKILLAAGADINVKFYESGEKWNLWSLFARGLRIRKSPLETKMAETMKILLAADPEGKDKALPELEFAIKRGFIDIVQAFIEAGFEVSAEDRKQVFISDMKKKSGVVEYAIKNNFLDMKSEHARAVLEAAADLGMKTAVEQLIEAGVEVSEEDMKDIERRLAEASQKNNPTPLPPNPLP